MSTTSETLPPAPARSALAAAARIGRSRPVRIMGWALALVVLLPGILHVLPQTVGSDHAFLVLSGSMEPLFSPGDIVFVDDTDPETLRVGDVVTFRASPGSDTLITHRVIEILTDGDHVRYRTQGDANEDPDPFVVHPDMVVGTYRFKIPYWGLLLNLIRSPVGYVVFIAVPCLTILGRNFLTLYRELDAWDRARKENAAEQAADPRESDAPRRRRRRWPLSSLLGALVALVLLAHPATAVLQPAALEPVNVLPASGSRTTFAHMSDGEPATGWIEAGAWGSDDPTLPAACERRPAPAAGPFRPEGTNPDPAGAADPGFAYDDLDCDGRYVPGTDRRIPLSDLLDGYAAEGCLVIPPSVGDVEADGALEFTTSGKRMTLGANLTAAEALALRSAGGAIDLWAVMLEAGEALLIDAGGGDVHLRATALQSARESVTIHTDGGGLVARHAELGAPERIELRTGGGLLDVREARLASSEQIHLHAGAGRVLAANLIVDTVESLEIVGSGTLDLARGCFTRLGESARVLSLDGPLNAHGSRLHVGEHLRLEALGNVDVRDAHLTAGETITLNAGVAHHTIRVGGATFDDADDLAQVLPSDVNVDGTPASGGVQR